MGKRRSSSASSSKANPSKKRRTEKQTTTLSELPNDVLMTIFRNLAGPDLARAERVCKAWRREISLPHNSVDLWRRICKRHAIPEKTMARDRARMVRWEEELSQAEPGTKQHKRAVRFSAKMWRDLYRKYRTRICICCGKCGKTPLESLPVCIDCRKRDCFAPLSASKSRRYFKVDPHEHPTLHKARVIAVHWTYGYPISRYHGTFQYNFTDIYQLAVKKHGLVKANKMAKRTSTLGRDGNSHIEGE